MSEEMSPRSFTPSVEYNSHGCEILHVREEDTKPGKGLSESTKKYLREKYGPKNPPADGGTPKRDEGDGG